jgi:hypothetical protein
MNSGTFQPYRTTSDPAIWPFFPAFGYTPSVVMTHPLQLLRWGWPRSQSIDPPQYFLEQFSRHRDLGHLEMTYRAPASSKRRCIRLALCCRAELDMETLVWTRGRALPLFCLDSLWVKSQS